MSRSKREFEHVTPVFNEYEAPDYREVVWHPITWNVCPQRKPVDDLFAEDSMQETNDAKTNTSRNDI
jgi:hypothetical protein